MHIANMKWGKNVMKGTIIIRSISQVSKKQIYAPGCIVLTKLDIRGAL